MDKTAVCTQNVRISCFGLIFSVLFAASSCIPTQQPKVCEVALECVYAISDGGAVGQANEFSEGANLQSPDNKAAVYGAFGEGGECWKNGPMDAYYGLCLETCQEILLEDCESSAICGEVLAREGITCEVLEADRL